MKRQSLGKKILFIGSILTLAVACQSKSDMKSSENGNQNENPAQSDNQDEDVDDGAYGDGDTSSSCGENGIIKVESATDVADIKDVDLDASSENSSQEISIATEENVSVNAVVLEAVTPVEIAPHQEEAISAAE